jgi:hypothetical protein
MSFAKLKSRNADLSKLVAAAEKAGGGEQQKSYGDDRFWTPTVDKSGNGYAVIRFLPAAEGEALPWVRFWDHGFKGPSGRWYIENSLTSIGQPDPVSEYNTTLWNTGREEDKETVRKQKRRLHYVCNILVVSDPGNPDNEGKVKLYKFGKKIFDKMMDVMQPQFADEAPTNPFDFWEGANFKLKIRNVEGYRNYDKSEFDKASALYDGNEARLEALYGTLNTLKDFVDPKNYKSYDELKTKLNTVLGNAAALPTAEKVVLEERGAEPTIRSVKETSYATIDAGNDDGEEDDTISYFSKLANS